MRQSCAFFSFFVAAFAACVGDDPQIAAVPDAASPADAAHEEEAEGGVDAAVDEAEAAAPRLCRHDEPFVRVEEVTELNLSGVQNFGARVSRDQLTVYFHRFDADRPARLMMAKRDTLQAAFGAVAPIELGATEQESDAFPAVSADQRILYFQRGTSNLNDNRDLWSAVWDGSRFATPRPVGGASAPDIAERTPYLGADQALWYAMYTTEAGIGAQRIARAAPGPTGFAAAVAIDLQTPAGAQDDAPVPSADGQALYFLSSRAPAGLWLAQREAGAFGAPQAVTSLHEDGAVNQPSDLTADNCTLYFARQGAGDMRFRIYRAAR